MSLYDDLMEQKNYSKADKYIADYVINNAKEVINMSITDLSKVLFVSTSSITKFCKRNKLKGYSDMKISISLELNRYLQNKNCISFELPITSLTPDDDISKILFELYQQTLVNTLSSINLEAIKNAAEIIYQSDYISLYGSGDSKLIGEDLLSKFKMINLPVDNQVVSTATGGIYRNKLTKYPVAIVISQYADTTRVKAWLDQLESFNYKIILITTNKNNFNPKIIKILVDTQENRALRISNLSSRIAMSYVSEILYLLLFKREFYQNYRLVINNKKNDKTVLEKFNMI